MLIRLIISRTLATIMVGVIGLSAVWAGFYYSGYDTFPVLPLSDNDGRTTIRTIEHSDPELDAAWKKAQVEAVAMWNDSSPDIHIEITDDSPNRIFFAPMPDSKLGYYVPTAACLIRDCIYGIYINEDFYTDYNEYHIKYRGRYLIAHELGHALGLNDIYHAETESIMHGQWKYVSRRPTETDVRRIEDRINVYRTLTSIDY